MFNQEEQAIVDQIKALKQTAGSHSPSIASLLAEVKGLEIKVDACFLSNPYATELFMEHLKKDLIDTGELRSYLEFYPTQNAEIAKILSPVLQMPHDNILVGNGGCEIIQALIHRFTKKKLLVILPTFSPYYEFARPDTEVIFHTLDKHADFKLDINAWIKTIHTHQPDTVILINPNNPNGAYIPVQVLKETFSQIKDVEQVILDESFVHFAFEDKSYQLISNLPLLKEFPNLITIKSMSKDFGIAGVRAGYAVMAKNKVHELLKNGYLWNISGLAEYFFRLFAKPEFRNLYEQLRIKHIHETQQFYSLLQTVSQIKVYPSQSNFFLVELSNGLKADEICMALLIQHGIYARSCSDKHGLQGEFIRIASRSLEENKLIISALKEVLADSCCG